jgi:hypothetical protein
MNDVRPLTRVLPLALLLAAFTLAVRPGVAQEGVTATSGSPAAIARIRAEYAAIEREAPGYRQTAHDVWNFSLEGGELLGFYRGRELRKLSARLFGESWRGSEAYYFADGRLIFIHVVQERYNGCSARAAYGRRSSIDTTWTAGGSSGGCGRSGRRTWARTCRTSIRSCRRC